MRLKQARRNNAMEVKGYRFNRQELAGALGDLGTFLPLAMALITICGVNASSLFLAAGLLYVGAGLYYGIPMPVQPLKATSVIAISMAAGPGMISATAISMGFIFVLACFFDLNEILNRFFPRPVIRGIQLSLGLILAKKGFNLFLDHRLLSNGREVMVNLAGVSLPLGIPVGLAALGLILALKDNRRFPAGLVVICLGVITGAVSSRLAGLDCLSLGWQAPDISLPRWSDFVVALPVLLLPQLPLTFANSIMATADTAGQYFGRQAGRVNPKALITSLGLANLLSGLIGGMPMCHGSGGLTAHYRFGARSGGASIIIGGIFIFIALILGQAAPAIFNLLPLAVLGVLLIYIGVAHTFLIRDIVCIPWELSLALGMGVLTVICGSLAVAFALGLPIALLGERLKERLHVDNHT
jgi:SulP family sulfate permease